MNQAKVKNPVNGTRSFSVEFLEFLNKSLVVKKKIGTVIAQTTRASTYIYNDDSDIQALLEGIDEVFRFFGTK